MEELDHPELLLPNPTCAESNHTVHASDAPDVAQDGSVNESLCQPYRTFSIDHSHSPQTIVTSWRHDTTRLSKCAHFDWKP